METKTLKNWIKLIVNNNPWAKSVTTLILVWAWSRYENQDNRWISHFLEHMFFKWWKKYKTAKDVASAIDATWWEFNAFTWKEYAWYYVKSAWKFLETSFDVLSDMLIEWAFPQEEIEKERWVILEEMNMYLDMPKYQVAWEFEELIIWSQPLGWDQLWTREFIKSVNQEDFQNYHKALYTPDNIVISLSWDITLAKWEELSEKYFSQLKWKKKFHWSDLEENNSDERIKVINKKTEQSHLFMWLRWTPWLDLDNFWKQRILSVLLWWMMSSRMFLNLREEKWLCYYIWTHTDDYTDFWILWAWAWVDNRRVDLAVEWILEEFKKMITNPPSQEELDKARNFIVWKLLLSTEDTEWIAHMHWRQQLLFWKTIEIDEMLKSIEKVTLEDINTYSEKYFRKENFYIAWIWPLEWKKEIWTKLLENY